MAPITLLASALLALGTGAGFAAVGNLVARREAGEPLPRFAFAAFWYAAGIVSLSQGLRTGAAWLGLDTMALIVAIESVSTPFYCMAAAALLFYVLFLLTGNKALATPVTVYYLALYPALRYQVARAAPIGYDVTAWQVNYVYAEPLQSAGYTLTLALVSLPVLLAIAAYVSITPKVESAATRYRMVCVAIGLGLWVGIEALTWMTMLAATPQGEILRRSLGLVAVAVVVAGYLPPAFAQRRWGARRIAS